MGILGYFKHVKNLMMSIYLKTFFKCSLYQYKYCFNKDVLQKYSRYIITFKRQCTTTSSLCKTVPKDEKTLINCNKVNNNCINSNFVNKYAERSHNCGELTNKNVGQSVLMCGWLQYQRMNKFIIIRDAYGETQLILADSDKNAKEIIEGLPLESIIQIRGKVVARPENMINRRQATGEIEVVVENLVVLNRAEERLPFNIREFQRAKESLRMQYRYLDLRFVQMQRHLRIRSQVIMRMRQFLIDHHFVDVETPTLFKATPGGAQEFIVPTRFPGLFYSLVQSPQQFKQTLMAGGIDRYFQIARCYRDEGSRPDRQPEFTQLDIELSFTSMEGIISLIEELLVHCWPQLLDAPLLKKPFHRIQYHEALELYGTDKPDIRFEFKLINCMDAFTLQETNNFGAYALLFPIKEKATLSKQIKEQLKKLSAANDYANVKFIQNKVNSVEELLEKHSKLFSNYKVNEKVFIEKLNMTDASVVFFAVGEKTEAQKLMGKVRIEYANHLESLGIQIRQKGMHLLWVYDFPLFEVCPEDQNKLQTVHHPFTAPHPDDMHLLQTQPLNMRALAYDLVLNGNEVGGGSIRIHNAQLQMTILKMLDIDVNTMSHLIEMLSSGCPPHGGIALGLDRLFAIMLNANSIRDVIAFPKTFEGRDPLSGAPSPISQKEQKLYHIQTIQNDIV